MALIVNTPFCSPLYSPSAPLSACQEPQALHSSRSLSDAELNLQTETRDPRPGALPTWGLRGLGHQSSLLVPGPAPLLQDTLSPA